FRRQLPENLLPILMPQIERDALLVASDDRPPERLPLRLFAAPLPHGIALARRLHLYDFCAEVAEQLAAKRTGEKRSKLDDSQIGEGTVLEFHVSQRPSAAPSCEAEARAAHSLNRGCSGGSRPVSVLQRCLSSSIDSKPR